MEYDSTKYSVPKSYFRVKSIDRKNRLNLGNVYRHEYIKKHSKIPFHFIKLHTNCH